MTLLMVGLFTCLSAQFIVLYISNHLIPKLKNILLAEYKTTYYLAIRKKNLSGREKRKYSLIRNIRQEEGKQPSNYLQAVTQNFSAEYLDALIAVEQSLLNFNHRGKSYGAILQTLGKTCKFSRVYVLENYYSDNGELLMCLRDEWCAQGIPSQINNHPWQNLSYVEFPPDWLQKLLRGEIVVEILRELSESNIQILGLQGIDAILLLPIISKGKFIGFMRFDDCVEARVWQATEIAFLQAVAGIISLANESLLVDNKLQQVIVETRNFASQLENRVQERTDQLHNEIAERQRIQQELEKSLSLQWATLESTADGILVVDTQGNVAGFNQKFLQMWRIPESLISSGNYRAALRVAMKELEDPRRYLATIRELHVNPDTQIYDAIAFKDGRVLERYSQPQRLGDKIVGRVWSFRDVTAHKLAEARIRHQALHDLLTNLPNRVLFNERLAESLQQAHRSGNKLAVCFLDLDRFKTINDTLGHAIGDQLLQSVAQRLTKCLRVDDTLARWGGDEFTLLLPDINDAKNVAEIQEQILTAFKPVFDIENHHLHISVSIGIALYPMHGEDAETLIKHADAALYRVKSQGRNHYQFYHSGITSQTSELLILENSLYQALERQEFEVYYQPQVNIATGEITKFEALLRWKNFDLGFIPPEKFIPIAEDTGLILSIGEWVLQTACAQNKAWQDALEMPSLSVAVNLSARQFQQSNLVSMIEQILSQTKLNHQCLELEITESVAMKNIGLTQTILQELYNMGVSISIDDFGTGYSSLSYLKNFPIHCLKIDKSFVRDLKTGNYDAAIATAIIALAHGLNLAVVAEGVETEEQRNLLQVLNCKLMQGYLFSRPLSAEDTTKLLRKSKSRRFSNSFLVA
ncbi:MAG: EAL domain-containing protein [Goleter apudmare HA4340-LM2]|jgi:diguanylate cyclase (GGDEF)-like protein|nr:EAL domain-containing protein [Goleter apudmare HA4340-LM2]